MELKLFYRFLLIFLLIRKRKKLDFVIILLFSKVKRNYAFKVYSERIFIIDFN